MITENPFQVGDHVRLSHSPLHYVGTVAGWEYNDFHQRWVVVLNNGSVISPKMLERVPEEELWKK